MIVCHWSLLRLGEFIPIAFGIREVGGSGPRLTAYFSRASGHIIPSTRQIVSWLGNPFS